eukprot:jgi/Mesen1/7608/ME000397S06671
MTHEESVLSKQMEKDADVGKVDDKTTTQGSVQELTDQVLHQSSDKQKALAAGSKKEPKGKADEITPSQQVHAKSSRLECALALLVPLIVACLMSGLVYWHYLTKDFEDITKTTDLLPSEKQALFQFEDTTMADIHEAYRTGTLTSLRLTEHYFTKIKLLNPSLTAVIETNPDARALASQRDTQLQSGGGRIGYVHGMPILVKDCIATSDKMNTTAGSVALLGSRVSSAASVVDKLRFAGAVVLGTTSMPEWTSLGEHDKPPRGGWTRNPYSGERDAPAFSDGAAVAVAANLAVAALSVETDGEILVGASRAGVVGLKPTVGLTSRAGVLSVSHTQDSVGPIARTVADAVTLLDVITAQVEDPRDSATSRCYNMLPRGGFRQALKVDGARGKRIGVLKPPSVRKKIDINNDEQLAFQTHISTLRRLGAEIVEDLELPQHILEAVMSATAERTVVVHEARAGFDKYLATLQHSPSGRSLDELLAFAEESLQSDTAVGNMQFLRDAALTEGLQAAAYKAAVELTQEYTTGGIDHVMKQHQLDALLAPSSPSFGLHKLAAIAGYPGVTVPSGYSSEGLPMGLTFVGHACSDLSLVAMAFAFEQSTMARKPLTTPFLSMLLTGRTCKLHEYGETCAVEDN